MPVDDRHPCCLRADGRLWVIVGEATAGPRPPRRRVRTGAGGAAGGALALLVVAWSVWGVRDALALATVALLGGAVGAVTAIGTARFGSAEEVEADVPPGAVELLPSIARLAPDDATGSELVAWATRGLRLRRARRALLEGGTDPESGRSPGSTVAARIAEAEREHRRALDDWAPVGDLLGLPHP